MMLRMDQIDIKFAVEFDYCPADREPNVATLWVTLPADENGCLITELRSNNDYVCNTKLFAYWGSAHIEGRKNKITIAGNSWNEVNVKLYKMIKLIVFTLQNVYNHNAMMLQKMPYFAPCSINLHDNKLVSNTGDDIIECL